MLNSKASINIHTNSEIRSFFEDNKALAKWKSKDGKLIFGEISIPAGRNEKGKPVYRTYSINNKTDLELAKSDLKYYISNLIESIKSTANAEGKLSDEATITAINKLSQQFNEIDDLEYNIHTLLNIQGVSFTVNPVLEQFNQIHYLFSQQFILSTVGSHVNHPIKKGIVNINEKGESVMSPFDFIKEESGRTNA
jgi:hypothetical protein